MVISIRGGKYWLWRAVDNEGEVQSAPIVGFPLLFLGLIAVLPSSALALPVVYGDREYCATSSARRFRWQPLVNLSAAAYSSAAVRAERASRLSVSGQTKSGKMWCWGRNLETSAVP